MITMTGYDRTYQPPRTLRHAAANCNVNHPVIRRFVLGQLTAWDMLDPILASVPGACDWADRTVLSTLAAAAAPGTQALDCDDCTDTGFYGLPDPQDDDTLINLFRRVGNNGYESLNADGTWHEVAINLNVEMLSLELAQDLADAILTGAAGLTRRFYWPVAFLPPGAILAATPGLPEDAPPADDWAAFAIVDDLDTGAVLQVIRLRPGPELERYDKGGQWVPDPDLLSQLQGVKPPPLVELDPDKLKSVLDQIDQPAGDQPTAASGLLADAPLTVSPDPRAEKLRRYWTSGEGAAKIRWGTPGDWKRCFRHLSKYMGVRAKGYCQNLHKRATGVWTGSKLNASAYPQVSGSSTMSTMSTEEALVAAIQASTWSGEDGRKPTMAGIKDGIYEETVDDVFQGIVRGLTAGAFPVKPPDTWFQNPKFDQLTPLTVEDDGQVYGHMASFEMPHIGLPGKVRAPRSHSNYAYFRTGAVRTASGKLQPVGQLTLVGGHAPLNADAGSAVAHYDNTNSAICDVNIGEDRYGIWFAGALRPDAKPEQVRAFMASALSGDWRPINGHLELVACCSVNVPGFPIARALAAGGAIVAMVAAGARPIALKKVSMLADAAVVERLAALEQAVYPAARLDEAPAEEVIETDTPVDIPETTADDVAEKIARARARVAEVKAQRRQELRDRVHGKKPEAEAEEKEPVAAGAGPKG